MYFKYTPLYFIMLVCLCYPILSGPFLQSMTHPWGLGVEKTASR